VIPFDEMWKRLKALRKDRTPIVLFGSEPFSSALRMSNIKEYKYDWIWEKNRHSNFLQAKTEPRRLYENISIFYNKLCLYNPQMIKASNETIKRNNRARNKRSRPNGGQYNIKNPSDTTGVRELFPANIIRFNLEQNNQYVKRVFHPTQKPVALMEYLIKTYTKEGDLVLDFTCGSGSTGVAANKLNRSFIGIDSGICEKEGKYFNMPWVDVARERINS
jgi:site-specific DNA-methyltransferase (adenine-specific)